MTLLEQIRENAKKANKRVVLPEGEEERTLKAADTILGEGIAQLVLIGNPETIKAEADKLGLKNIAKAQIVDTKTYAFSTVIPFALRISAIISAYCCFLA